ncbi:hypothetical protein GCM10010869_00120 [Mesorhizobium tianshanense]|nr:FkbM family methyltransferase [Mesorhizobium tianshanense]GLS34424.1 hypothetical protein GCM10010869_00120 [Mesorhizobium tianshanense]
MSVKYAAGVLLRKSWKCQLKVEGVYLYVRPGTPDLDVCCSSLGDEFSEIANIARDTHKFIVDAGGYIGSSAIFFARRFPESRIIVLEPDVENFGIAQLNCRPYQNVEVWNLALAGNAGRAKLRDRGTGAWGYTVVEEPTDCDTRIRGTVDLITVDHIVEMCAVQGIDILKLDIEGGEYSLLEDVPGWIQRCDVIVAELHDRIKSGCTEMFYKAMKGRTQFHLAGEKVASVSDAITT